MKFNKSAILLALVLLGGCASKKDEDAGFRLGSSVAHKIATEQELSTIDDNLANLQSRGNAEEVDIKCIRKSLDELGASKEEKAPRYARLRALQVAVLDRTIASLQDNRYKSTVENNLRVINGTYETVSKMEMTADERALRNDRLHRLLVSECGRAISCMRGMRLGYANPSSDLVAIHDIPLSLRWLASYNLNAQYAMNMQDVRMGKRELGVETILKNIGQSDNKYYTLERNRVGSPLEYYSDVYARFLGYNMNDILNEEAARKTAAAICGFVEQGKVSWSDLGAGVRSKKDLEQLLDALAYQQYFQFEAFVMVVGEISSESMEERDYYIRRSCDMHLSAKEQEEASCKVKLLLAPRNMHTIADKLRNAVAAGKINWQQIGFRDKEEFEKFVATM